MPSDTDASIGTGGAPLLRVAENGHEGMVKTLLERDDFNPDKPDKRSRVPLLRPASNMHEGEVKIFLERANEGLTRGLSVRGEG